MEQIIQNHCCSAGAPFVVINTVMGGLMAYGLTGLRYTGYAIVMYLVVLCLQALISNQLQIFCVWLTPNQVPPPPSPSPIPSFFVPPNVRQFWVHKVLS